MKKKHIIRSVAKKVRLLDGSTGHKVVNYWSDGSVTTIVW